MDDNPMQLVVNCATGEQTYEPITGDNLDAFTVRAEAEAELEAQMESVRQAKIAQAQQILAANPDYQIILDALGVGLP